MRAGTGIKYNSISEQKMYFEEGFTDVETNKLQKEIRASKIPGGFLSSKRNRKGEMVK